MGAGRLGTDEGNWKDHGRSVDWTSVWKDLWDGSRDGRRTQSHGRHTAVRKRGTRVGEALGGEAGGPGWVSESGRPGTCRGT